jgi:hypothetical protein
MSSPAQSKSECPRCLFTSDFSQIGKHQCEYCDLHDKLESEAQSKSLEKLIEDLKIEQTRKKYACIMGISGGLDSSTLLYTAVKHWELNPLVIHFDNHWNAPEAEHNMARLIQELNVDAIKFCVNKQEYDMLNLAFLMAGTPDADIPNDIAMTKLMYDTANKYGIKYILNGHCYKTEGSTPKPWTYMDALYIQDVYTTHTGKKLSSYPLFTIWDQLKYGFKGIKNVRPFHMMDERKSLEEEMKELIEWKDYGGKHCENVYTEFVGAKLLPEKFGIDKRIVYLSAQVRSGELTKAQAREIFSQTPNFDMEKLNRFRFKKAAQNALEQEPQSRESYQRYNFKRYRLIFWFLSKLRVVPTTFYVKYCK